MVGPVELKPDPVTVKDVLSPPILDTPDIVPAE